MGSRAAGGYSAIAPTRMRSRCSIPSQCLVNPYPTRQNYRTIYHLVPVLYITPLLAKYKEYRLLRYLMKAWGGERCSCCRTPFFVAFKIPDLHSSFFTACVAYGMNFPFLISIRVYFAQRANKSPFALHRLCCHCRLIKYSIVFTRWNLQLSTTP